MLTLTRSLLSRTLPLNSKLHDFFICKRGIRGVEKIFRTKLPKYKTNLSRLPPLTKLLTNDDDALREQGFSEMRREKFEVYLSYIPENSNKNLLEALFHDIADVDILLKLISENLDTMTSFYLGLSFEALDDMMRAQLCDPSTVAVAPEFNQLCAKTLYKIRFFEADEVLKLLKCLSSLGAPDSILLVQAALQMTRHLINDFNHEELNALSDALEKIKLVDNSSKSLLLVLRAAIETQVKRRLEP